MKLIIATALLVSFVKSDGISAINNLKATEFRRDRDLAIILGASLDNLQNYGCWCIAPGRQGRGPPVDGIDQLCKTLSDCYACAEADHEDAGQGSCDPSSVPYNSGTSGGIPALVSNCEAQNTDLCAQFACMCEGVFSTNFIQTILGGGSLNPANNISNGFDDRASCPIQEGVQTEDRECCGLLPFRFPFKPVDKECCGAEVFDPSLKDCCSDNTAQFSCV
jgi:hypothetical protein